MKARKPTQAKAISDPIGTFCTTILNSSTQRAYQTDLRSFAQWLEAKYEEAFDATSITSSDVHRYKQHLIRKSRAPATINRALVSISKLAKWCVAQGVCKDNFAADVKAVQVVKPGPQALSDVERDRLIRAVTNSGNLRDIAIIVMLAHTGLRVAELCSLKRRDIKLSDRKGELNVHGKGEKFRVVPLVREVRTALIAYLETQTDQEVFLFIGQRGPLTDAGAYEIVKKYAALAKIECHPHTLRHGFATHYLRHNPSDLVGLAQLLGHESLDTTARYTIPTVEDLAERMQA